MEGVECWEARPNVGPCKEHFPRSTCGLDARIRDNGDGLVISATPMRVCVRPETGCLRTKMARKITDENCRVRDGPGRRDCIFALGESWSLLGGCRRLNGPDQEEERREQPKANSDVRQNVGPCAIRPAASLFHLSKHALLCTEIQALSWLFVVHANQCSLVTDATAPAAQIEAHIWHRRTGQHSRPSSALGTFGPPDADFVGRAAIHDHYSKRTSGMASDRDPHRFARKVSRWRECVILGTTCANVLDNHFLQQLGPKAARPLSG